MLTRFTVLAAAGVFAPSRTAIAQFSQVHSFAGGGAAFPQTSLVQGTDGNFYGTTQGGPYVTDSGDANYGAVFKMTPDGTVSVLHFFDGGATDGAFPSSLIQATDGNFYGTTAGGGHGSSTFFAGTVFKLSPGGTVSIVHFFDGTDGASDPQVALIQATDGNFYGTTAGGYANGSYYSGTIFKMTSDGAVTVLHFFVGTDGPGPGNLIQAKDGELYGASAGGFYNGGTFSGTVFRMALDGSSFTVLHTFSGGAGGGDLIQATDGNFYGLTSGSMFKITPSGTFTTFHVFSGAVPASGVVQATDGNFYGITGNGGLNGEGSVFRMTPMGVVTLVHSFDLTDGAGPAAALIQASDGSLYGTTGSGGATAGGGDTYGDGTVFKVTLSGNFSLLHSFDRGTIEGSRPSATLIQGTDSNLYGTAVYGGTLGLGTVFKTTPDGALTVLHSFGGYPTDGRNPSVALVEASDGNFYGTTQFDGPGDLGTVFRIAADGSYSIVHSFAGGVADGATPLAALIQATDGNLYGTTYDGGSADEGTIYKMTLTGTVTIVHSFTGMADGGFPQGPFLQATDGNFYGMNFNGLFRMTPNGTVTILHPFSSDISSDIQRGLSLVQAKDGNLYGTGQGNESGCGAVLFKMTLYGTYSDVHCFTDANADLGPETLLQATDGNFYGTTRTLNALVKVTPAGTATILHRFSTALTNGLYPGAGLLQTMDGKLYGATEFGGEFGAGLVFRLSLPQPFTDDPLIVGVTPIKAVHITELRTRIDAVRAHYGLAGYPYSDPSIIAGASVVRAVDITDLRIALSQAYVAAGLTPPSYSTSPAVGVTIRVADIADLRSAVQTIELQ